MTFFKLVLMTLLVPVRTITFSTTVLVIKLHANIHMFGCVCLYVCVCLSESVSICLTVPVCLHACMKMVNIISLYLRLVGVWADVSQ